MLKKDVENLKTQYCRVPPYYLILRTDKIHQNMTKKFSFFLLMSSLIINVSAQIIDLDKVNTLFSEGEYSIAQNLYQNLLNDAEEGLATLDELASTDWEFHALHGVLYDHLGRFEDAQNSYGAALEFSPRNVSVLNNLSISLAQAGKLDEAISLLIDLVNSEYANPQVRQNLALLYGLKGDLAEAMSLANEDLPPETVAQNLEAFRMLHE